MCTLPLTPTHEYKFKIKIDHAASDTTASCRGVEEEEEEDEWLPCCYAGFGDMNSEDAKALKSANGIFDCTCFKVPDKAQFPRVN